MAKYIRIAAFAIAALVATTATGDTTNESPEEIQLHRDHERQLKCLADNIYHEAGSESTAGKLAVAQIVVNRTENPKFPDDPCQVIYQKTRVDNKVICQFSWHCDKSIRNRKINQAMWNESYDAARRVLLEGFRFPKLQNALYFHAEHVNPGWALRRAAKIGRHIFY
jgi:spore germination cell wall hydrolase CwlJ-like protein